MSQFGNQDMYAYGDQTAEPPRTSGMAIASLVLSLVGIIPCLGLITAPIGALLGLIGVATISPPTKGKGVAVAGLLFGVLFFGGQLYGSKMLYDFFAGFMKFVQEGPRTAMNEGFGGNIGAFKAEFHGRGATMSNDEAQAFIDELRSRYGDFVSCRFDESGGQPAQPPMGQPVFPMPYVLEFENQTVNASVELVFADPTQQQAGFLKKLGYILVQDPDLGDLRYPPTKDADETDTDSDAGAPADSGAEAGGG